MRILVRPKNLEIGGSQESAVALASGLARLGEDVVVVAPDGPLADNLAMGGAMHLVIPSASARARRVATWGRVLRDVQPDVAVGFEYPAVVELAAATAFARTRTPVAAMIHATRVPWFLPETVHLSVAREELRRFTQQWWGPPIHLAPPPIPELDRTGVVSHDASPRLVLVSRLVENFKSEGIIRAIESMRHVRSSGATLTIAGDGPARARYEEIAGQVNADVGRVAVTFVGAVTDPLPVLETASLVLGSGMSVMHGAALGRPCVVLGRDGFVVEVTFETLDQLCDDGFYGAGGSIGSAAQLAGVVDSVLDRPDTRELERLRETILNRYGASAVALAYRDELKLVAEGRSPSIGEVGRAVGRRLHYRARRAQFRRSVPTDRQTPEQVDDYVYGRLRDMPVNGCRLTGRHRSMASGAAT